jgi:predicted nicotinamide N-methyase
LTLIQKEFEIEPIFSGAAWAGSVLWAAAEALVTTQLLAGATSVAGRRVLELGAGLGIPGMVCSLLGAQEAVLSEQPQLVPLLDDNVARNFDPSASGNGLAGSTVFKPAADDAAASSENGAIDHRVVVRPSTSALSWGTAETDEFLEARRAALSLVNRSDELDFHVILVCDCVFEPLYGDSWKLLADSLAVLAHPSGLVEKLDSGASAAESAEGTDAAVGDEEGCSAATVVLIACERRDEDGIPEFLARLDAAFEVTTAWTNYEDAELGKLLEGSHVAGERKPLRIFSATRREGRAR